MAYGLLVMSVD